MKIIPGNGKVNLTNDGSLEICFIGTGSAFAKTMYQTNFLIIKGNDHILVDFGTSGLYALREFTGLEPTDIRVFLPTHSHADHVGGVECLALMNHYVGMPYMSHPKLKMIINEEYEKILWNMTLRGGLAWNEIHNNATEMNFSDYFTAIRPQLISRSPREIWEVSVGDIHVEMFRTKHVPEQSTSWKTSFISYGVFIDNRVFCSMDTRFDRELIDYYIDRSEILFHDVQFFRGSVHTPLDDLQTLPSDYKKKTYLIHYTDDWQHHDISDFAGFAIQGSRYVF